MESDKTMFEIYRDITYSGKFKVCYFTELGDHNKEFEILRATDGEHFFDGFLRNWRKDQGKSIIDGFLKRLNDGEKLSPADLSSALKDHLAP